MKKIISILIIINNILIITGCIKRTNNILKDTVIATESTNSQAIIIKASDLIVKDIASEYIINAKTLSTYTNYNDKDISYVNINEFINFLDGAIVELTINKEEEMIISHTMEVPVEYYDIFKSETYTYEMIIDAEKDLITFNDFDMISVLNIPTLTNYETELEVTNIEYVEGKPTVVIDLSQYNFDIIKYQNEFYLPLHLANLFFTGSYLNVYEMDNQIFVIDNFSELTELNNYFPSDITLNFANIRNHTDNFLALYFDYFYGLKEYKNIETYVNILDSYRLEKQRNFTELQKEIDLFISNQNDLHTSIITPGYMNGTYRQSGHASPKMIKYVNAYYKNQCTTRKDEISFKTYDNLIVIEINSFSLDTKELLKPVMEIATDYDNIAIDLGCNGGGYLIGIVELLSYMTDNLIPISYLNPVTDSITIEYYHPNGITLKNKNYYIFTTPVTFSAANLFTSIVKDLELGTIIGANSSGGASAITYTVLPNGSIIVNSSNLTFINKNKVIIEDGINVDFKYTYPFDFPNIIEEITN